MFTSVIVPTTSFSCILPYSVIMCISYQDMSVATGYVSCLGRNSSVGREGGAVAGVL